MSAILKTTVEKIAKGGVDWTRKAPGRKIKVLEKQKKEQGFLSFKSIKNTNNQKRFQANRKREQNMIAKFIEAKKNDSRSDS